MKVEIFVLTHKEINESYDEELYKPLLTGAVFKDNPYNYLTDDKGDNISNLNEYYGELSGEYWAWKNSKNDIIGFSQRRRWFVKNYKFEKLSKNDIITDLETHDIILPHKFKRIETLYEYQKKSDSIFPDYDVKYDDYVKVEEVLRKNFPEYGEAYHNIMNGHILYTNNMFICKRKLANEYFKYLFDAFDKLWDELDLSKYENRDKRIFGFLSERLLTTFVIKNKLKVKEYNLYKNEAFNPYLEIIERNHPHFRVITDKIRPFAINFFKILKIYKD